jgi:hypothetical protein
MKARLEARKIVPSEELAKLEFQKFEKNASQRRKMSMLDAEKAAEGRRASVRLGYLMPLENGPQSADLSVTEREVQMRWEKLDKFKAESEESRLKTKEELWEDANEEFGKRQDRQRCERGGSVAQIAKKEGDDINNSDEEDSGLAVAASRLSLLFSSPAVLFCLVLVPVDIIILIIQETSCQKQEKSMFDNSCFGG